MSQGSELLPAVCAWDRLSCRAKNCAAKQTLSTLDHKVLGASVPFFMLMHLRGRCEKEVGRANAFQKAQGKAPCPIWLISGMQC